MLSRLIIISALLFQSCVFASERRKICVEHETEVGYSKPYAVSATMTTGDELNSETGLVSYYPGINYVVIFWGQHEATIINIKLGSVYVFPTYGTDQQGRRWKLYANLTCPG